MGISWLLLAAGAVIFLQALLFRKRALKHLAYSREFSQSRCYAGEQVELVENLTNRKLLPLPWLRMESMIPAGLRFDKQVNLDMSSGQLYQNHKSLFSLMPYTRIVRSHKITCEARGYYRLNSATMTAGDLLGMRAAVQPVAAPTSLIVYPRFIALDEVEIRSNSFQGDVTVRRWVVDDPFLVSGVREYRYGDSLNRVNWKATARSGRLQVHERDFTADPRIVILVNMEVSEHMWAAVTDPAMIERALSIAATLTNDAISRGIPVGFGTNGWLIDGDKQAVHIGPDGGAKHLTLLLETMAKLVVERCEPMDVLLEQEVLRGTAHTDYVLLSAYVSPAMREWMRQLEAQGNSVSRIHLEPTPLTEKRGEEDGQ
ncbi:DUF58 domain-containing protein [Gorillibacterium timonense]|uniref:DUF58 domain-containing protein n=1 Tax=Gorillibacterium timonense TaxID=1689269 RepID=UPI00071D2E2A|nr:DUF58 domain-containing protein [Gorillibacterium timonense]